jgi:hypothetical protein
MHRREICLLTVILIGILALGFTVTMGSFADNLLASAADVIVGIFIALYLVDRISRRERACKWERVKLLTYHSIESACDLMIFTFQTMTSSGMDMSLNETKKYVETKKGPDGARATSSPRPRPQYKAFLELSEKIGNELDSPLDVRPIVVDPQLRGGNSETRGGVTYVSDEEHASRLRDTQMHVLSSQYLLSEITPSFEKLSFHIFPRIFELDEQEGLISSLIEVEAAFQEWENNVDAIEGDWGMPEEFAWKAAAQFCDRIGEMLKIIYLSENASEHPDQSGRSTRPWSRGLRGILPRKPKVNS